MAHPPNAELLMVAWIKSLSGIPEGGVATKLPSDPAMWAAAGFVQVGVVAGSPEVHTPLRGPVVQIDCWANNINSEKVPWGKASALAETIVNACYKNNQQRVFGMPVGFTAARLLCVWPLIEPRRIPDDEAGFARVSVDLAVRWTAA